MAFFFLSLLLLSLGSLTLAEIFMLSSPVSQNRLGMCVCMYVYIILAFTFILKPKIALPQATLPFLIAFVCSHLLDTYFLLVNILFNFFFFFRFYVCHIHSTELGFASWINLKLLFLKWKLPFLLNHFLSHSHRAFSPQTLNFLCCMGVHPISNVAVVSGE